MKELANAIQMIVNAAMKAPLNFEENQSLRLALASVNKGIEDLEEKYPELKEPTQLAEVPKEEVVNG